MAMDVKRYVWTDEELQALQNKGLHLRCPMEITHKVQVVRDASERDYVAKSLPNDSNELDVFRTLLTLRSPRNHVIPCELLPCAKSTVALMPWLEAVIVPQIPLFHGTVTLVDILSQLIEGLQFMHDHRIVYGDMASMNMVTWEGWCAKEFYSCPIVRGRIYFIDFGSSRCFPKGPGEGLRIMDWSTFRGRLIPPEGKDEVDPYAYDVYSLGETMYQFCQTARSVYKYHSPQSLNNVIDTLRSPNPSHRPTARRAARICRALSLWVLKTSWLYRMLPRQFAERIDHYGWRFISLFF